MVLLDMQNAIGFVLKIVVKSVLAARSTDLF